MASPVAHSLTGAMIYFACSRGREPRKSELLLVILAANLADFDLIPGLLLGDESLFHRTVSHSFLFTAVVWATVCIVLASRRGPGNTGRLSLMIGLALCSQLLIDWLSYDDSSPQGIALLWPFSDHYFMSDETVFLNVRRDHLTTIAVVLHNLKALLVECLIVGPPTYLAWRLHRSR